MKKGDIVTIYEDPISQQIVEGKAELLEKLREEGGFGGETRQYWRVKFENGDITDRLVKI